MRLQKGKYKHEKSLIHTYYLFNYQTFHISIESFDRKNILNNFRIFEWLFIQLFYLM